MNGTCSVVGCGRRTWFTRTVCQTHYKDLVAGRPFRDPATIRKPVVFLRERFEARYSIDAASGCWLWTAKLNEDGYGLIDVATAGGKRTVGAHRVAWTLFRGPIPDGLSVLHKCDVRRCVNHADHLFLGTQAENVADCVAKGRFRRGPNPSEVHGMAKMTWATVDRLRADAATGAFTNVELSARYGVGTANVSRIVNLQLWKHRPPTSGG